MCVSPNNAKHGNAYAASKNSDQQATDGAERYVNITPDTGPFLALLQVVPACNIPKIGPAMPATSAVSA